MVPPKLHAGSDQNAKVWVFCGVLKSLTVLERVLNISRKTQVPSVAMKGKHTYVRVQYESRRYVHAQARREPFFYWNPCPPTCLVWRLVERQIWRTGTLGGLPAMLVVWLHRGNRGLSRTVRNSVCVCFCITSPTGRGRMGMCVWVCADYNIPGTCFLLELTCDVN